MILEESLFRTVVASPGYVLRVCHDEARAPRRLAWRATSTACSSKWTRCQTPPRCAAPSSSTSADVRRVLGGISARALAPVAAAVFAERIVRTPASGILVTLLRTLVPLERDARRMWVSGTEDTLLDLLLRASTPDCVARCIDPDLLCRRRRRHDRADVTGMAIVRRLACCDATRYADARASALAPPASHA